MNGSAQSDLKGVFRKHGEIVSREIAGETILVPVRGRLADMQRIYSLSPVAAFLWEQLDGQQDVEVILGKVMDNFDVGQQAAAKDIGEFIGQLLDAGLLEAVGP